MLWIRYNITISINCCVDVGPILHYIIVNSSQKYNIQKIVSVEDLSSMACFLEDKDVHITYHLSLLSSVVDLQYKVL